MKNNTRRNILLLILFIVFVVVLGTIHMMRTNTASTESSLKVPSKKVATHKKKPASVQPAPNDMPDPEADIESLIKIIESRLESAEKNGQEIDPWLTNKVRFILARAYAATGDYSQSRSMFTQIEKIRDRRILVRPFLDALATAVRDDDKEQMTEIIVSAEKTAEIINAVQFSSTLFDPEFGTIVGKPVPVDWLEKTFCEFAGKKLAAARRLDTLDEILSLASCEKSARILSNLKRMALTLEGSLIEAYRSAPSGAAAVTVFESCADISLLKTEEFKDFLHSEADKSRQEKDTDALISLADLLRMSGDKKAAFAILSDIEETPKIQRALLALYEEFYLEKNEEMTRAAATILNLSEQKVFLTGGWGAKNPHQWWVEPIQTGHILAQWPSPLALDLAASIKDDKARFKVLMDLFLNMSDQKPGDFPGCEDTPNDCIIADLTDIAKVEKDEHIRDTMYGFLSEMARLKGDAALSKDFLGHIMNMERSNCAFDMCMYKTVIPLKFSPRPPPPGKSDVSLPVATSGALRDLLDRREFELAENNDMPLAAAMRALHQKLESENADYHDVSSQSGYRIGYLHPLPNRRTIGSRRVPSCPL